VWTEEGQTASFDVLALEGEEIKLGQKGFYNLQDKKVENYEIKKV
jgi:hypothetical protein